MYLSLRRTSKPDKLRLITEKFFRNFTLEIFLREGAMQKRGHNLEPPLGSVTIILGYLYIILYILSIITENLHFFIKIFNFYLILLKFIAIVVNIDHTNANSKAIVVMRLDYCNIVSRLRYYDVSTCNVLLNNVKGCFIVYHFIVLIIHR